MAGRQLLNAPEYGLGARNPEQGQELMQGLQIHFRPEIGQQEQGLGLGGESKARALVQVVQGFNPKMVPGQK